MYRSLTCVRTHIAEREIEVLLPSAAAVHNSGFVCIGGEGWEMKNVCITLKKKKGPFPSWAPAQSLLLSEWAYQNSSPKAFVVGTATRNPKPGAGATT